MQPGNEFARFDRNPENRTNRWSKSAVRTIGGVLWQPHNEAPSPKTHSAARRYFAFYVNPDGSFRADDIPPGRYKLRIQKNANMHLVVDNGP